MSIRTLSARAAGFVDRALSRRVPLFERPALIAFLFHSLFEDRAQIDDDLVYPQEGLTKTDLRRFISYFLEAEYEVVSAAQIRSGLSEESRCLHVTFDDGYANNIAVGEILEEFGVPATIFVATDNVESGNCFWWDVLYRERRRRGSAEATVEAEMRALKKQKPADIRTYLESEFGPGSWRPVSDLDRPLSREELSALSRNRWITIGNHTKNHAILTRLDRQGIRAELEGAQDYLEGVLGERPRTVAYPNGDYDDNVLEIARACGLQVGVTADPKKNRAHSTDAELLTLGRYRIEREIDLIEQLHASRSGLQLANLGRRFLRRGKAAG